MTTPILEEQDAYWREKPKAHAKHLDDKYSTAKPKDGASNVGTGSSRSNNGSFNSTNDLSRKERQSK